jgi:hypothetical protein
MHRLKRRWTLAALVLVVGLGLGAKPAHAYTTSQCFGDTLYVDFWSASGVWQGYLQQNHSPLCV